MDEVDKIQSAYLEENKIARNLGQLYRFLSHRIQLNKNEGILRMNLEIDLNKSPLMRNLLQNAYLEVILLLAESMAIKYSFALNRLASAIFLLSKVVGFANLDSVNREKWDGLVSSLYEIFQKIQNQRRSLTPENINVNDILVPLNRILETVRSWQNGNVYYSKPIQSKL